MPEKSGSPSNSMRSAEWTPCSSIPIRFEQALCNLLDNAIKHSPEDSVVRVDAGAGDARRRDAIHRMLSRECAVISVHDQGPGIRAEEARDLFSDFLRGHEREGEGRHRARACHHQGDRPCPWGAGRGKTVAIRAAVSSSQYP
ncbi:MAG: ATP-binding protein [Anaerotruncus sp.]|nr:ATP-binding protein [Anaerotruncus sp.]